MTWSPSKPQACPHRVPLCLLCSETHLRSSSCIPCAQLDPATALLAPNAQSGRWPASSATRASPSLPHVLSDLCWAALPESSLALCSQIVGLHSEPPPRSLASRALLSLIFLPSPFLAPLRAPRSHSLHRLCSRVNTPSICSVPSCAHRSSPPRTPCIAAVPHCAHRLSCRNPYAASVAGHAHTATRRCTLCTARSALCACRSMTRAVFAFPPLPLVLADRRAAARLAHTPQPGITMLADNPPPALHCARGRLCSQNAGPLSLHLLCSCLCSQIPAPPHSLHTLLCRLCSQTAFPPHSMHSLLCRLCLQISLPPHSLHTRFSLPCLHTWQFVIFLGVAVAAEHHARRELAALQHGPDAGLPGTQQEQARC